MFQHGHPQAESRPQKADHALGVFAKILAQDGGQFFLANTTADQAVAVVIFRQKWLTAIRLMSFPQPVFKREVLKSM